MRPGWAGPHRAATPAGPRPVPPGPRPRPARSLASSAPARPRFGPTRSAIPPRRFAGPLPDVHECRQERPVNRCRRRCSELTVLLAPGPLPGNPLVVLGELVDLTDPADLRLRAREHRHPPGPLHRLLDGGDVEEVEAAEQFLGLPVRTVGNQRRFTRVVHDEADLGIE